MSARSGAASPPRPLVPIAIAVAGGVWAGESPDALWGLATAAVAVAVAWRLAGSAALRSAVVLAWVAGTAAAWSYAVRLPAPDDIAHEAPGEYATVVGVVCGDVYPHARSIVCPLRVVRIERHGEPSARADGRLVAFLTAQPGRRVPDYGDTLEVHGRLDEPSEATDPGAFDSSAFAARNGVRRTLTTRRPDDWRFAEDRSDCVDLAPRLGARVREAFLAGLRRFLPEPRSTLVGAIVLGSSSGLPDALKDDFITTGTAHVLAASGYNVAVVALCALPLGRRFGLSRRPAALLALAMVGAYVLIAGAKPSVVRAGVMAALFLGAELLDRDADAANVLAASAIAILLADPPALLDVGFQLSYAIVAAIVATSPLLAATARASIAWAERHRLPAWAGRIAAAVTVAAATTAIAQLAALPLMAQHFNQAPLMGLLANALILPMVGAMTVAGLLLGVLALSAPPLAGLLAPVVGVCATLVLGAARLFAQLPLASLAVPSPGWPAVALYGLLFAAIVAWARRRVRADDRREIQPW